MLVTIKNPGFDHSINSIMLFQVKGLTSFWSNALSYFFPQIDKVLVHGTIL